jgi:hypothetical protein
VEDARNTSRNDPFQKSSASPSHRRRIRLASHTRVPRINTNVHGADDARTGCASAWVRASRLAHLGTTPARRTSGGAAATCHAKTFGQRRHPAVLALSRPV